jgi:hypothetical protein
MTPAAGGPPAASEVSALIAWMRRLSDAGVRNASPAELAAFRRAKQDLLARISHRDQPGESDD